MRQIRICAVVTGKTIDDFLRNLEAIQELADLIELRVDYINGFSLSDVDLIKNETKRQAIFTCRKKEEGGIFAGTESARKVILEKAMDAGFDFVDVEMSSASTSDFASLKKSKTKIILSFHDFTKTPKTSELNEIKKQMKKYQADIMKFATFVQDDADSKILFQFLFDKQDSEEMIVVGMGEKGKMIRVAGPLFGSYLTYASTDYSQSAPGQIDVSRLKKLYNEFREI